MRCLRCAVFCQVFIATALFQAGHHGSHRILCSLSHVWDAVTLTVRATTDLCPRLYNEAQKWGSDAGVGGMPHNLTATFEAFGPT